MLDFNGAIMKKILFLCFFSCASILSYAQTTLSSSGGLDPATGTVLSSTHGFVSDDYNQWQINREKLLKQDAQLRSSANLGEGAIIQNTSQMNGQEAFKKCFSQAKTDNLGHYNNTKLQNCMQHLGYRVQETEESLVPGTAIHEQEENQMLNAAKYEAVEGAIEMKVMQYNNQNLTSSTETQLNHSTNTNGANAQLVNSSTTKSISIQQTSPGIIHLK